MPRFSEYVTLVVKHIVVRTTVQDLKDLFSKYGQVMDVFIPVDTKTGLRRRYGFVRFRWRKGADDAMDALDGHVLHGSALWVRRAYRRFGYNIPLIKKLDMMPYSRRNPRLVHDRSRSKSTDRNGSDEPKTKCGIPVCRRRPMYYGYCRSLSTSTDRSHSRSDSRSRHRDRSSSRSYRSSSSNRYGYRRRSTSSKSSHSGSNSDSKTRRHRSRQRSRSSSQGAKTKKPRSPSSDSADSFK